MRVRLVMLNGKNKSCSWCEGQEFELSGFHTVSVGKKYRQLEADVRCAYCSNAARVRVGKLRTLEAV